MADLDATCHSELMSSVVLFFVDDEQTLLP